MAGGEEIAPEAFLRPLGDKLVVPQETLRAVDWFLYLPTGSGIDSVLALLQYGDITQAEDRPMGTPDLITIRDDYLPIFHPIHTVRSYASGRLTLRVPERTAYLLERLMQTNLPLPIQRRNYCDGELRKTTHFDQVYYDVRRWQSATAQGPNARDSIPTVSVSAIFTKSATLIERLPTDAIATLVPGSTVGSLNVKYGTSGGCDRELCQTVYIMYSYDAPASPRSIVARSKTGGVWQSTDWEIIYENLVDEFEFTELFEYRGRVWLLGTYNEQPGDDYSGITVLDPALDTYFPDEDYRIAFDDLALPLLSNGINWKRMCINGPLGGIMYALYWDIAGFQPYHNGVMRSYDYGLTWRPSYLDKSDPDTDFYDIAAAGEVAAIVGFDPAFSKGTVIYSVDSGESFDSTKISNVQLLGIDMVQVSPNDSTKVIVYIAGVSGDDIVVLKGDEKFNRFVLIHQFNAFGFTGTTNKVYVKTSLSGWSVWVCATIASGFGGRVWNSTDGGYSWKEYEYTPPKSVSSRGGIHFDVCNDDPSVAIVSY